MFNPVRPVPGCYDGVALSIRSESGSEKSTMNLIAHWPKTKMVVICVILVLPGIEVAHTRTVSSADFPKASSCSASEYRQFDFWLGDWDAFEGSSSTPAARVHVNSLLDGCVVHEDYQDTTGKRGQSFSIYDASRKTWHQSWVTNRGQLLVIEGNFQAGEMVLTGAEIVAGKKRLVRGTWMAVKGGVREIGVTSVDEGKTWQPWFDLMFRPHQE